jgi:glycosyltransferase involved in cell wall biosynthesis
MSNSLMEAMAAGIPCAASHIDANRELIRDGETGSLFPLGSGPEIARCLLRFQRNPERTARLASQAAEFVRSELSPEQMISRHLELYRRLLNR